MAESERQELYERLGSGLRQVRTLLGLNQEQMARRLGMPAQVYWRLEGGRALPSTARLKRICQLLGVSADSLLGLSARQEPTWLRPPPVPGGTPPMRGLLHALQELSDATRSALLEVMKRMALRNARLRQGASSSS